MPLIRKEGAKTVRMPSVMSSIGNDTYGKSCILPNVANLLLNTDSPTGIELESKHTTIGSLCRAESN
jgi:hypothetical protein